MNVFHRFYPHLQQAIVSRLGWKSLRPVQELSGEAILDGHNLIILAPTAGGKTEASVFPVISCMLQEQVQGVKAIYIAPIRALLNNLEERLGIYTEMVGLSRFKWHGEAKAQDKKSFIQEPADLLMTTPESLEAMLISPKVPSKKLFQNLRVVIIDEIHALAACDRGGHLAALLERLKAQAGYDFQRIGLSATIGNPQEILHWLQGSSQRSQVVINPPKQASKKQIAVQYLDEQAVAQQITQRATHYKSLCFCNSRHLAEILGKAMNASKIRIFVHHSSVSREEREIAEAAMTQESNICIICTSTLELGIDVGELDKIFQIECPNTVSSFLQRMGRTGRRPGSQMNTTFFTTSSETMLQAIALIELARKHWIESVRLNNRSWHLLTHQIMALCLQYGAITRLKAWTLLNGSSCFHGIPENEFQQLTDHLIHENYLSEESGLISMGVAAEQDFGRRNFMELYSVFSTPEHFEVKSIGGQNLGTIEWQFADVIEEGYCFLLAGCAWIVQRIELKKRVVWVSKAPAGKAPKWGGFAPNLLSYELCRKMYEILTSGEQYPYCEKDTGVQLSQLREDKYFLRSHPAPMQGEGEHLFWWTYAGGRINNTLKHAISYLKPYEIIANNYYLKIKGENTTVTMMTELIGKMQQENFWESDKFRQYILKNLPAHRLSKFQHCLPKPYQMELIANEFLDIPDTIRFLKEHWMATD